MLRTCWLEVDVGTAQTPRRSGLFVAQPAIELSLREIPPPLRRIGRTLDVVYFGECGAVSLLPQVTRISSRDQG
jgi:hypothetical protein